MTKERIIAEIQRTAKENGGSPLGWRRFEEATGIRYYDWYGIHWARWSDATREAGLEPNRMSAAITDSHLLECLVSLTRKLKRVPIHGDIRLAAQSDTSFPSDKVFRKLGSKAQMVVRMISYCKEAGHEDVAALWHQIPVAKPRVEEIVNPEEASPVGYVYLLQHGSRREFKIGRTNNPIRREGEMGIQLPEKLEPVHYIKTDDPSGVERYWHIRFADKRKEGEWFGLSVQDVRAFKRWKNIF